MSVVEDTELRDLVKQALEKSGVLPKIRAELRANVFLVLDQNSLQDNKFRNEKLKKFMDTEDGVKSVKIIREFLEYFDLNFTAAVFDEEVLRGRHYDYCGPSEFLEDFEHVSEGPVIAQLLSVVKRSSINHKQTESSVSDEGSKLEDRINFDNRNCSSPSDFFTKQSHKNDLDDFFASVADKNKSFNVSARFDSSLDFEKMENNSNLMDNNSTIQSGRPNSTNGNKHNSLTSLDDLPPLTVPSTHGDVTFTLSAKHKNISEKLKSVLADNSDNNFNDISQASSLSDDEKKKYQNRNKTRSFGDGSHSQDEESISEIDELLSAGNDDTASNNSGGEEIINGMT